MTRPQIVTLELEDCSDALVEYVERLELNQLPEGYITAPAGAWHDLVQKELRVAQLEQALAYESDLAEQALQSREALAAELKIMKIAAWNVITTAMKLKAVQEDIDSFTNLVLLKSILYSVATPEEYRGLNNEPTK